MKFVGPLCWNVLNELNLECQVIGEYGRQHKRWNMQINSDNLPKKKN